MNKLARLPAEDRRDIFTEAAALRLEIPSRSAAQIASILWHRHAIAVSERTTRDQLHRRGLQRAALEAELQARMKVLGRLDGPGVTLAASDQVWADPTLTTLRSYLNAVAPGYDADLIVVDGDPLTDIAAVGKLRRVIARGRDYLPDSGRFDVSAPGTPFASPDHRPDLRLLTAATRRRQA